MAIQEIVAWKEPSSFDAAFVLVQQKEANLLSILQPQIITGAATPVVTRLVQSTLATNKNTNKASMKRDDISQLVSETRDLKLFLIQGQSFRAQRVQLQIIE